MILTLTRGLLILLIYFTITSCSKQGPTCGVSDQLVFLKEFEISGTTHYLYERRSGFSDKVSFLEHYNSLPEFDQCGEPSVEQVSQIPISEAVGAPTAIIIKDMVIDIAYDNNRDYSTPDLINLPIRVE